MPPFRRFLAPLVALALAVPLAACDTTDETTTEPSNVTIETATYASSLGVDLAQSTPTATGLWYRTLSQSTAPGVPQTAAVGQRATVRYTGYLTNGTQFDANTITFKVGAGEVIAGYDQGVAGMRVGERRQLIIPPALAYGSTGRGPIPPNAIIVFVVELLSVAAA